MARPIVIDTDGGVDDAVALWWALTDPELEVVAITVVWGNVDVETATASVLRVVHAAGRDDVPVAVGARGPWLPAPDLRPATFIHGDDGLGNAAGPVAPLHAVGEPAPAFLARLISQRPGELTIVTLGPLTNLGVAIRDHPQLVTDARDIVVMGGSARRGGNALPYGEANVAHDPLAAQRAVLAPWTRSPMLIGLDVTLAATLRPAEFELLAEHRTPAARFLDSPLNFYRRFGSTFTAPDTPCHDLLTVLAVSVPEIIEDAPVLPLAVDCGGDAAWGTTVVDFRAPFFTALNGSTQSVPPGFAPWRIALGVDVERFRACVRALFGGS
ncbi:MAG TPA: nucleoside hydrolase [Acidimicrobiia bacterium]|nr:nucleoside hydrolase [Acidimicrobiia bacterium]